MTKNQKLLAYTVLIILAISCSVILKSTKADALAVPSTQPPSCNVTTLPNTYMDSIRAGIISTTNGTAGAVDNTDTSLVIYKRAGRPATELWYMAATAPSRIVLVPDYVSGSSNMQPVVQWLDNSSGAYIFTGNITTTSGTVTNKAFAAKAFSENGRRQQFYSDTAVCISGVRNMYTDPPGAVLNYSYPFPTYVTTGWTWQPATLDNTTVPTPPSSGGVTEEEVRDLLIQFFGLGLATLVAYVLVREFRYRS